MNTFVTPPAATKRKALSSLNMPPAPPFTKRLVLQLTECERDVSHLAPELPQLVLDKCHGDECIQLPSYYHRSFVGDRVKSRHSATAFPPVLPFLEKTTNTDIVENVCGDQNVPLKRFVSTNPAA
jgi:hypothetical protein